MEDYIFAEFLSECKVVEEATHYLEIFNYSNPHYDTVEEHPLSDDEFENFLNRRGAFAPPERMPANVKLLSGLRLVVQKNASDKDTFAPKYISLPKARYASMMRTLRLPLRGIETHAIVGPFFWCTLEENDEGQYLQILHRKSDVRKKGKTRGWEMMLSHCFETCITTGFVKGTESSDMARSLAQLTACAKQVGHPMLLPTVVLAYDLSPVNDQKQREARDWLRRLENAVSMRDEVDQDERYASDLLIQVDGLNRDLVECHGHVMWKRPQAYFELVREMELCLERFASLTSRKRRAATATLTATTEEEEEVHRREIDRLHRSMVSRMEFYRVKLKGLENYIHTTLERLKVQREALYNIMTQREARLNLQIAGEQRRIAHASKRDSTAMKTISLLGALFLPGTLLASVFSMTFFNFNGEATVSAWVWVYFAITIPITVLIVLFWVWYDRRREAQYERDDKELEEDIENMEKDIMNSMRKRTMSRAHTWNTALSMGPAA